MTKIIEGVPESLTYDQVVEWLAWIGIDASRIPIGESITFGPGVLSIRVFSVDENGRRYIGSDGKHAAIDDISIRLTDSPVFFKEYPEAPTE